MCKIIFNENREKFNQILKEFSINLGLKSVHFDLVQSLIESRCDIEKVNFEIFLKPNSTKFAWVKQVYIYMVYHYVEPELLKRDLELLCFIFGLDLRERTRISLEVKFAPIHSKYHSESLLKEGLAASFLYKPNMSEGKLSISCALLLFGNHVILKDLNESDSDTLYEKGKQVIKKLFVDDLLKEGQWQDLFGKVESCGVQEETPIIIPEVKSEPEKKEELEIDQDFQDKLAIIKDKLKNIEIEEKVIVKEIVPEIVEEVKVFKDFDIYVDLDKSKSRTISLGMFLIFALLGLLMGSLLIGILGGAIMASIVYPLYQQRVSLSFSDDKFSLRLDDQVISMEYGDILRIERRQDQKMVLIFRDIHLQPIEIDPSNEDFEKFEARVKESDLMHCLVEVNG